MVIRCFVVVCGVIWIVFTNCNRCYCWGV